MAVLNEAQLALYNKNMKEHVADIVGGFGHYQSTPNVKGSEATEAEIIEKRNIANKTSATVAGNSAYNDHTDSSEISFSEDEESSSSDMYDYYDEYVDDDYSGSSDDWLSPDYDYPFCSDHVRCTIRKSHARNFKGVYVGVIDNPNPNIDRVCKHVCKYIKDQMINFHNYDEFKPLLNDLLKYLKLHCPQFLKFPRREDLSKDWQFTRSELFEANREYVGRFFSGKKDMEYHFGYILMLTESEYGYRFQSISDIVVYLLDMIFEALEDYFLHALDKKADKEAINDMEYDQMLAKFIRIRKAQLWELGFSDALVSELIQREHFFWDVRARICVKPLPDCYLLDKFNDDECFELFGFDKIMLKYLAMVLNIPKSIVCKTEISQMNVANKVVTVDTFEDPTAALAICLARLSSSASLVIMSKLLGIDSKTISNITHNVANFINTNFSHLLNIDNCNYNRDYSKLMVAKSSFGLPGLKQHTTHMIHESYTKLSTPAEYINSSNNVTGNGKLKCDTVRLQFVTDCLGMFIDVNPAALEVENDRSLFKSSNITKRLSTLKFRNTDFYVVGDSACVSGNVVDNEGTDVVECDDENGWNVYGVPIKGDESRSQSEISTIRNFIERPYEIRNLLFKSLEKKGRPNISLTSITRENAVTCIFSNIRQILYCSPCSHPISDVLPVDFYLLMWGALSDKKPLTATF